MLWDVALGVWVGAILIVGSTFALWLLISILKDEIGSIKRDQWFSLGGWRLAIVIGFALSIVVMALFASRKP